MKKVACFAAVLAVLACASTALAYGSLVSSFKSPEPAPNGVGWARWSTSGFWVNCNDRQNRYRMTTTGSIYASFRNPGPDSMGCGAANIGGIGYVFVANDTYIYRIGMGSGSIYSSYRGPGSSPFGVGYCGTGGTYVYSTDYRGPPRRRLYFMHAYTGSVYRSHALSFSPAGVGYDPRGYLWISDPDHSIIWQCTTTGSAINSFSVSRYGAPTGCGCDGTYVYAGMANPPNFWVMKFETSPAGIAPASWGEVKALFR